MPTRVSLLLGLLLAAPSPAQARQGAVAVINMSGASGHRLANQAVEILGSTIGGWSRQPEIAAYLSAAPGPATLPAGAVGVELRQLLARLRSGKATASEMATLGRLLGVDYLLLLAVRGDDYAARLFSVHRPGYAPHSLEAPISEPRRLKPYLQEETRPAAAPAAKGWRQRWRKRWWIVGLAAVVGGVTLGLALANGDPGNGELRVRVSR